MYARFIKSRLTDALADTRVVLLNGARQVGKSTLARQLADHLGGQYLTLDDPATVALARADPMALVQHGGGLLVVDEVQLAPELFPAIKQVVDVDTRPGQFLLTGSANVFLLPRLSESLAGRMEILPLFPLSQGEMVGTAHNLVDVLFGERDLRLERVPLDRLEVCERIIAGGFPEAVARVPGERRDAWFRSYVASLLQRDVRDLANIEGLTDLPRLLGLIAARTGALSNVSEISRAVGLPLTTLRRYLTLLEATFIYQPLPAWSANIGKRFVKSAKHYLLDSGLVAQLRGAGDARALSSSLDLGPLLETFVVQEVRKLLSWSRPSATAWHFRTAAGQEVDLILEAPGRRIVGFEVKASATVGPSDFKGLRALADAVGDSFSGGAVLYLGEQCLPCGDRLWALPVAMLWHA
jgi:hypothetical protein